MKTKSGTIAGLRECRRLAASLGLPQISLNLNTVEDLEGAIADELNDAKVAGMKKIWDIVHERFPETSSFEELVAEYKASQNA